MALTGLAGNFGQFIVINISHTNNKDTETCKCNIDSVKYSYRILFISGEASKYIRMNAWCKQQALKRDNIYMFLYLNFLDLQKNPY